MTRLSDAPTPLRGSSATRALLTVGIAVLIGIAGFAGPRIVTLARVHALDQQTAKNLEAWSELAAQLADANDAARALYEQSQGKVADQSTLDALARAIDTAHTRAPRAALPVLPGARNVEAARSRRDQSAAVVAAKQRVAIQLDAAVEAVIASRVVWDAKH